MSEYSQILESFKRVYLTEDKINKQMETIQWRRGNANLDPLDSEPLRNAAIINLEICAELHADMEWDMIRLFNRVEQSVEERRRH